MIASAFSLQLHNLSPAPSRSRRTSTVAEQIIVLHDGWLFIAAAPPAVADVRRAIHALAGRWGVRIVPGPQTWSWFSAAH
jgi:hypothetical protein